MKFDLILAGVGGQGILTLSYLLDHASVNRGFHFKQAEVHGMSQRGGAVYSHMRISDTEVISDLIPKGQADMILSVEPLEVQRYLDFLNQAGTVVSSNQPYVNIPDYPPEEVVINGVLDCGKAVLVNTHELALAARMPRAQNLAILGAATPFLPFDRGDFEPPLKTLFSEKGDKVVDGNLLALELGYKTGLFYKTLLDNKVPNRLIYNLIGRLEPVSIDPELAPLFANAMLTGVAVEQKLQRIEGKVSCEPGLAQVLRNP